MELVEVEREVPAFVKVRAEAQDKLRLGREQLPPLARPELLDVVDRLDAEDRPDLLGQVKRAEWDADAQVPSGPLELRGRRRSQRPGQTRSPPAP